MTRVFFRLALLLALVFLPAARLAAQPMGTFVWQLAPYCNVVSLATTQNGAVYEFEGTDNQCGASTVATVRGLAVINPNGSVGIGLTIVTAPGGLPVHVQGTIDLGSLGGPWTDDHGNSGTFVFAPAAPTGAPRPLASAGIPNGAVTSAKILDGSVAAVDVNAAEVQKRVTGACAAGELMTGVNEDGSVACAAVSSSSGGDITGVTAGLGLLGGGTSGAVTLNVNAAVVQSRVTGTCAASESIRAIAANGTVTCVAVGGSASGDVTAVMAGVGLTGGGASGDLTLSADLAGSGVATSMARSDHTHERVSNSNTAVGSEALQSAFNADMNTAVGRRALQSAVSAISNTAVGWEALRDTSGQENTAVGHQAARLLTSGSSNTAVGASALYTGGAGGNNVAVGHGALDVSTGGANVALGANTFGSLTTGSRNLAAGNLAGSSLTSGDDNIYLLNSGVAAESATIRIGTSQTRAFLSGVRGVTTANNNAVAVVVDSAGQLGTVSSSAKTKFDIQDLPVDVTDAVSRLRPVSFRYKRPFADGSTPVQYGLIAEEVEQVLPELVAYDEHGDPATVKYHVLPSLLLAEVQRLQSALRAESSRTAALEAAVAELRATLAARER